MRAILQAFLLDSSPSSGWGYLASAAAAAELREMSGVGDDGDQSEPEDDPADGESPDAESGS
jgi:hypothetical protein